MTQQNKHKPDATSKTESGDGCATCSALIRRCNVCGVINAVDLAPTEQREKDLSMPEHTIMSVTREEAKRLWASARKCDHNALIAEMRDYIMQCSFGGSDVTPGRIHEWYSSRWPNAEGHAAAACSTETNSELSPPSHAPTC